MSNSAACRAVGINRRTGTRWRYGRDIPATGGRTLHYPPVVTTNRPTSISARYLSEDERIQISDLRQTGATVRVIAAELGRSPSTISRELRRNADPAGHYRPSAAHRSAVVRRTRYRARRVDRDVVLRARVQQLLALRWSPEQISRRFRSSTSMTRRGGWSPSRSTKPSTTRAAASFATAPACRHAPDDPAAARTGALMLAAVVTWWR